MGCRARFAVVGVALVAGLALSGCKIDVDLIATPLEVPLGGQVNLKVKVTNRFNCPVRNVFAIVIPFVPRGTLINEIDDPDIRNHV
jgi:hypothetical protein